MNDICQQIGIIENFELDTLNTKKDKKQIIQNGTCN